MLAGTDDHLTWLSPVILNLESTGLTHLESEVRVDCDHALLNNWKPPLPTKNLVRLSTIYKSLVIYLEYYSFQLEQNSNVFQNCYFAKQILF